MAEVREQKQRAEFRRQRPERFDHWLDVLEAQVKEPNPTLEQITRAVWEVRQELTGSLTEALVEHRSGREQAQPHASCPQGGRQVAARGVVSRTVATVVGAVELSRPYFSCMPCGPGFAPVDATVGVAPGRKQFDLQPAAATLAAAVPSETAQALFKELRGVDRSTARMPELTNAVGEELGVLDGAPPRAAIAAKIAAVAQGHPWRPLVGWASDGAEVPTRPEGAQGQRPGRKQQRAKRARWQGQWREAQGLRFYLLDEDRIVPLRRWPQSQDDAELFAARRQGKEAGLIPADPVRLWVVAAGAHWIGQGGQQLFPTAEEILDYYHGAEHIHTLAELQYGEQPERAFEWVAATLARRFAGEVDRVIGGLHRLRPATLTARAAIDPLLGYLQHNRTRIKYRSQRKAGYPLGSGGIESAPKCIGHARLNRSGAWWYVAHSNHKHDRRRRKESVWRLLRCRPRP